MTLRQRFLLYLLVLHGIALVLAVVYHEALGYGFFAVEAAVLISGIIGYRLLSRALAPLDFVQAFADVLNEREFSTRFATVGMPEMDSLIRTYNRMLEKLYAERLRVGEQRGFVERFLEATPIGVVVLDFDRRIHLVNAAAAALLEHEAASLVGKRLNQIDSSLAQRAATLPVGGDELVLHAGARRLRLEHEVFTDRGFERSFVLIEELTAVLNESERSAWHKLVRIMSHEVNNTVAATNSLLESCTHYAPQLSSEDRADFVDALNVVMRRNQHLNHFMGEFARVVRLPQPRREPIELDALLRHVETMFRAECAQRHIRWVRSGDSQLPRVALDREQMEQALINIIKNALEAVHEHGRIELHAHSDGRHVHLSVVDDGCGIDPARQGELFTPFYSSKPDGQGLGLTLVKEILLKHEFDFDLTCGAGSTTFRISMPLGVSAPS